MSAATAARLQELRQAIASLEAERAELIERVRQVDARIDALEKTIRRRDRGGV
jgi:hypothetical protein